MTMGKRIKKLRKERHMTQQQLADKLLIKKSSLSAYENDVTDIKASILKEIAVALDVNVGYFFGEEMVEEKMSEEIKQWMEMYNQIKNDEIRKVAMTQVRALLCL